MGSFSSWTGGIWDFLNVVLRPILGELIAQIRRFKWLVGSVLLGALVPVFAVVRELIWLSDMIRVGTERMRDYQDQLQMNSASSMWAQLSQGASLVNCVVPLDFALSIASVLLSWFVLACGIKAAVWLWRMLPLT